MGYYAGYLNEGDNNTFLGSSSGNHNTTGYDNTFVGRFSGRSNVAGDHNTMLGSNAGYANTGSYNTFLGSYAGKDNSGGTYNVFTGRGAGEGNVLGSSNCFLGYRAGFQNANAGMNVFLGTLAGYGIPAVTATHLSAITPGIIMRRVQETYSLVEMLAMMKRAATNSTFIIREVQNRSSGGL